MPTIHVKDGTAIEGHSKCMTCTHRHVISGYRENELMVFCDYAAQLIRIPFKVRECSGYRDTNRPDWEQMEKLAIEIEPLTSAKPAGFGAGIDSAEIEDEERPVDL